MVSQLPKTLRLPFSELKEYDLETAILCTLAYSDVFDFPLTAKEVHRYLIGYKATPDEVKAELFSMQARTVILSQEDLFALPGRELNFSNRQKRFSYSSMLWRESDRYGTWISRLPFIRMVAATGALVSNNVDTGADLDYFVITNPGWLWTVRAMILAMDRIASRTGRRAHLCPNYIITTTSLELPDQDLFTAQEMARMVPISGLGMYRRFRHKNKWTDVFLPNAQNDPWALASKNMENQSKATAEFFFNNPISRRIEKWEMKRKIRKLSDMAKDNHETRFSADLCKGHFDSHKHHTLQAFERRIQDLGLVL